jgi:hypothetical protein
VHQHRNTTPKIHSEMHTSLGNTRHLVLSNSGRGCSRFVVPQLKYVHTAGPSQRYTKNSVGFSHKTKTRPNLKRNSIAFCQFIAKA